MATMIEPIQDTIGNNKFGDSSTDFNSYDDNFNYSNLISQFSMHNIWSRLQQQIQFQLERPNINKVIKRVASNEQLQNGIQYFKDKTSNIQKNFNNYSEIILDKAEKQIDQVCNILEKTAHIKYEVNNAIQIKDKVKNQVFDKQKIQFILSLKERIIIILQKLKFIAQGVTYLGISIPQTIIKAGQKLNLKDNVETIIILQELLSQFLQQQYVNPFKNYLSNQITISKNKYKNLVVKFYANLSVQQFQELVNVIKQNIQLMKQAVFVQIQDKVIIKISKENIKSAPFYLKAEVEKLIQILIQFQYTKSAKSLLNNGFVAGQQIAQGSIQKAKDIISIKDIIKMNGIKNKSIELYEDVMKSLKEKQNNLKQKADQIKKQIEQKKQEKNLIELHMLNQHK